MPPVVTKKAPRKSLVFKGVNQQQCVGVVLAGGQSKRMGTDKALLTDNRAKSCLQNSIDRLIAIGLKKIVVSGERTVDNFCTNSDVEIQVISDLMPGSGPLAALDSILEQVSAKQLLITPVDMPYLEAGFLNRLLVNNDQYSSCFTDFLLPLKLIIDGQTRQVIKDCLSASDAKKHSIKNLFHQIPHSQLPLTAAEHDYFQNTNTPEQWQRFLNSKNSFISHVQEESFRHVS